jgi:hypothetical protein
MKKLLFLTAFFCFFTLSAGDAFACSCLRPSQQSLSQKVKKSYREAAAVFYGEVTEITQKPENSYVTVKLKVEKSWKNQAGREVVIQTGRGGGGDCGYRFEIGNKYLVYAYRSESILETNICLRTSASDADSKYLDKIKKPKLFSK